ncbi:MULTISPECIES: Mor transcription activator family protein [unclassified Clostridioides]|uniref:Mor transcription activator family protein n=1 Tax=unclassified Clostridioides TaxID=2635829 RepID=UPI001D12ABFA|nr:transcriptional regulator [Clostridioides sp. ZZV15-6388]MCC0645134.1 transcriptional regulator [Clostridioides sp. ZZV14-6150]MCC0661260.1 transcriptional regulator [Clostridioides sp. ZZV14-6154]MCC0669082.1 transcriptional regulator [Clostridioides sp. ZZV14-6153]MCC0719476.1 transcriptional regulator [Clostridioides sp. ZZV14-6105]MCC0723103.1 transcriptional regulator [Clostridioides sp. ZZV14-6104]MCC0727285.1 transcriptional regulator [Clostridioides sp. ZZV14-6045]MCC0731007.1 tra
MLELEKIIELLEEHNIEVSIPKELHKYNLLEYLKLCQQSGGTYFYIKTVEGALKEARNELMIKLFNGKNYMELARMFDMSVINVRYIVRKK